MVVGAASSLASLAVSSVVLCSVAASAVGVAMAMAMPLLLPSAHRPLPTTTLTLS